MSFDSIKRLTKATLNTVVGSKRLARLGYACELYQFSKQQLPACRQFDDRLKLYSYLSGELCQKEAVLYLEFGVYKGNSIRAWSEMQQHPESRFLGFDSFEGLPENWDNEHARGHFSTEGTVPVIDDPRVRFIRGWFNKSLPGFLQTELTPLLRNRRLIVHLDADLFSSTLFVLSQLAGHIPNNSLLVFDEFFDAMHEFRAYCVFAETFGIQLQPLAWSGTDPYFPRQLAFSTNIPLNPVEP